MPNHTSLASLFSDIADAIRAKTGGSAQIAADDFPTAIAAIPAGLTLAPPLTARRSGNLTISFTNLLAEPRFFVLYAPTQIQNTTSGNYRVVFVLFDGASTYGASVYYRSDQATWQIQTTYTYSWNNSAKTLTITSPTSRQFQNTFDYKLLYAY